MASLSAVRFLDQLRDCQILEPAQLEEINNYAEAQEDDPRPLARRIVEKGWLTKFQINMIGQGRGKDLIIGSYLVLERIGEGGMGQVYKARHQHMNRVVALKVIRKERLNSPDAVRRFYKEIQAAAQLSHPNIVLAYDAGQTGPTHFFAMEYVEGMDLAHMVQESGPIPVGQACDYIRQAALGLEHAFERGLVHRDIKPANLLVARLSKKSEQSGPGPSTSKSGSLGAAVVKILDMGLARLHGPAETDTGFTKDGVVMGTPEYLAPEQATNARAADIRSDLYSLGCTFYFLLAGRPPFQGGSLTEVLLAHQLNPAPPVSQFRPEVPEQITAIVARLMAKNPAERFQTPAELADVLAPYCQGAAAPAGATGTAKAVSAQEGFGWDALATATDADGAAPSPVVATVEQAEEDFAGSSPTPAKRKPPVQSSSTKRKLMFGIGMSIHALILIAFLVWYMNRKTESDNDAEPKKSPVVAEAPRTTKPRVERPTAPEPKVQPTAKVVPEQPVRPEPPVNPPTPEIPLGSGEERVFTGHRGGLRAAAFSADGRQVYTWGSDSTLRHWDLVTGKEVLQLPVSANVAAFSSDGRLALSAIGQSIILWDAETGKQIRPFAARPGQGNANISCLALSHDKRFALSGAHDNLVDLWEVSTGKLQRQFSGFKSWVMNVAFTPDGRRAFAGSGNGVVLGWDVETGLEVNGLTKRGDYFYTNLAFSPDSRTVLLHGRNRGLGLWDLSTWQERHPFQGDTRITHALAFSPDGRRVASANENTVFVWDRDTGQELHRYQGFPGRVRGLVFGPDNKHFLAYFTNGTVRVWSASAGPTFVVKPPQPDPPITKPPVVKAPVPEVAKQDEVAKLIRDLYKDDFAKKAAADRVALAEKLIDVARDTKDKPVERFVLLREARDLAADAGDARIALKAVDELANGYVIDLLEMKIAVLGKLADLAMTPAAARSVVDQYLTLTDIAVARDDYEKALRLASLAEAVAKKTTSNLLINQVDARGKSLRELQEGFEAVKKFAAVLKDKPQDPEANLALGKFYCLNKGDWEKGLRCLAAGNDDSLKSVALKELAGPEKPADQVEVGNAWYELAKQEQAVVRLQMQRRAYYWYELGVTSVTGITKTQTETRMKELEGLPGFKPLEPVGLVRTMEGHGAEVRAVAIAQDGQTALSAANERSMRLWNVRTGKEVRRLDTSGEIRAMAMTPDGQKAVTLSADGMLQAWDVESGRSTYNMSYGIRNTLVESVAIAPNGSRFVYSYNGTYVSVHNLDVALSPGLGVSDRLGGTIRCMTISPNGQFVVVGTSEGLVHLCHLDTRKVSPFRGSHTGAVLNVAISRDGRYVLSGGADKNVWLWDVLTGKTVRSFRPHGGAVRAVAFSPDGMRVLTGSADKTIRLWDSKTGAKLLVLDGHDGEVTSLAYAADGSHVLSGSTDKTVRWWRVPK
jgi:WD40 repeat protein/serine/threonine protein kinase